MEECRSQSGDGVRASAGGNNGERICIGTLGKFSASTGKAKSKKTFNLSAIVAAALCDRPVLCYTASLPENKRNILYVDTEQSAYHC